jgi:predicted transcriptional regulator
MPDHPAGPAMRQKIFSMDLAVETVSLYLLCCAVTDAGAAITRDTLADKWNGDRDSLEQELRRLEQRNIISRKEGEGQPSPLYQMVDEARWS